MSLRNLLSKPVNSFATLAGLGGAIALSLNPNLSDNAKGIMQLGRAYERRLEMQAKVMRHNDYRLYVKTASGSRLPLRKLAA